MPNQQPVTPQFLIEGACHSLEQCGSLLNDAATLFSAQSYPTSIVLAMFAREELGSFEILRELHAEVVSGEPLTVSDIKERCVDHVTKQAAAQPSTVI